MSKLTKRADDLVEYFGQAAMDHGWGRDQGTGVSVDHAAAEYEETKADLKKYIATLQKKARKAAPRG